MKWVKDFKLLQEFGCQPRIWLEYNNRGIWYCTDGYVVDVNPDTLDGLPMFIALPSWEENHVVRKFTEKHFKKIRELNAYWYPSGTTLLLFNSRKKLIKAYTKTLVDCKVSKTGLLYSTQIEQQYVKRQLPSVFTPNRCRVTKRGENTKIILIDDAQDLDTTFDTAKEYASLLPYNYITDVAAELINAKLRDTAIQLAGENPKGYYFTDGVYLDNCIFDYTLLNKCSNAVLKTPLGFVQINVPMYDPDVYVNVLTYLRGGYDREMNYSSTRLGYATIGLFCSHLEFKNNVLDIRIHSIIVTPDGYREILDIPLSLLDSPHMYLEKNPPKRVYISLHLMGIALDPVLLAYLDTSSTPEDVFSEDILKRLHPYSSYQRKGLPYKTTNTN